MTAWQKGVVLAVVQVTIVASLAGKLWYDRATCPRVWALTAPYDPSLPIRGRYVSLQVVVELRDVPSPELHAPLQDRPAVTLAREDDRLVARPNPDAHGYDPSALHVVQSGTRRGIGLSVLDQPVAFFIPEHIPDPSVLSRDEELWVEVTIPKKGPPRPIRTGPCDELVQADGEVTVFLDWYKEEDGRLKKQLSTPLTVKSTRWRTWGRKRVTAGTWVAVVRTEDSSWVCLREACHFSIAVEP